MANFDWNNLGFSYRKTNTILSCSYKDGQWGPVESHTDDNIKLSAFAGALHYSIECFEGLKAFRGADGKVRIFRPDENAARLQRSAAFMGIAAPSTELFIEMCVRVVKENIDFLPPYESQASMYLRPTLIGSNPQLGVKSSTECLFLMLCAPVGAYTGGNLQPSCTVISRDYDRAAPNGTGNLKLGSNYAASLYSYNLAHKLGYEAVLYLDPLTHTCIDEFGSSNFFAIRDNSYITPKSDTILPSITNKSLEAVAKELGMTVERRKVPVEELSTFEEVGECGTAVVITPVYRIDDKPALESGEVTTYPSGQQARCGEKSLKLYKTIRGIQYGEIEDPFGWCMFVE